MSEMLSVLPQKKLYIYNNTNDIRITSFSSDKYEILKSLKKFNILVCGRRWGKITFAFALALKYMVEGKRVWWISPIWRNTMRAYYKFCWALRGLVERKEIVTSKKYPRIKFQGGIIEFISGKNWEFAVGEGLDLVILDECALLKQELYEQSILPALLDRCGKILMISTPRGRNWFWKEFLKCKEDKENSTAIQRPTWQADHISQEEIAAIKERMSERIFKQEIGAEFLENSSNIFPKINVAMEKYKYTWNTDLVMGIDWGKHDDYTAVCIYDTVEKGVIEIDRWRYLDYRVQLERIQKKIEKYKNRLVKIVVETNAMGEVLKEQIIEMVSGTNIEVVPFFTTQKKKEEMIEKMIWDLEQEKIFLIPDEDFSNELYAYECVRNNIGNYSYSAPIGMHDDMVIACLLALYGWEAKPNFRYIL